MFCDNCGSSIDDHSHFCSECGAACAQAPVPTSGQAPRRDAQTLPMQARAAVPREEQVLPATAPSPPGSVPQTSPQAYQPTANWDTPPMTPRSMTVSGSLRRLLVDPVDGLCVSFEGLGSGGAIGVGVMLFAAFGLSLATAFVLLTSGDTITGEKGFMSPYLEDMFTGQPFMKVWLLFSSIPISLFICAFILGTILRAKGTAAAYVYTVGACLFPFELVIVIDSILGGGTFYFQAILLLFACCYLILMFYGGLTRLCGFSNRDGAPAVPIIIVVSAWLAKVVIVGILSHS